MLPFRLFLPVSMNPLLRFLAFLYGLTVALLAGVSALVSGTVLGLPFVVLPRGRRERYTIHSATVWSRTVLHGMLWIRPHVQGRVSLPEDTGALVICNHRSWVDPILLIRYTASNGLSKRAILYLPFIGFYGWLSGAVFFDRRDPADRKRAREEVMRLVRGGARVQLFPEGTRSKDGSLRAKVFLTLVRDCWEQGLPVIPCAVVGSERALPPGQRLAMPCQPVWLDIGQALQPADHASAEAFAQAAWADVGSRLAQLEATAATTSPKSHSHPSG